MSTETIVHWLPLFTALAIWELIWKGLALWRTGRRNEPVWFVAILVVNSVGLLPIIYLIMTSKLPKTDSDKPKAEN